MDGNQNKQYATIFRHLNKTSDFVAGIISVMLFVVVIIQVFGRLIGTSAPWTEEMTRYIFIWMIFIGVGIGFRKAESPRVTFLLNIMPETVKRLGRWIYAVATIGFLLFMVIYGVDLVRQQINMNETSSVLLIPMWIIGISIPISATLGIINTIQSLIYHRDLI
ncbi:TRAP transporter small permease [Oceanobacillus alkalisoli]|uniref:TRAP transporter small permease n=1 Tax=Oceanobacillus alkalisoli TaxID=2925113 RepID=UPI001F11A156|nr:TRAP transporter small permease [Oceanobacillus alkalisoli]MCF3942577.1 TRAP transporter small permease [Oceanobacillus alkalisoli]